ncbi:DUF3060 domain-containing protein [Mycobacterium marinum]|uniref:DUF3060 domain-containing protein n=1 Tax=Mycobacterium marinum TaxID=1781 RepID=UPI0035659203
MRAHLPMPRLAAIALTAIAVPTVLGLAGCSETASPPSPSSTSGSATPTSGPTAAPTTSGGPTTTASIEIGNMLNYGSIGTTATLDCADGKSLNVAGSENNLTVTGTCATVTIGGTNNKITFDKIDQRLTVLGIDNTITYKAGEPKVDNIGSGNNIEKG